MAEKVAEIEVSLKINDAEYTDSAGKARRETDKLEKSTKELTKASGAAAGQVKKTGDAIKQTGDKARSSSKEVERFATSLARLSHGITASGLVGMVGGGVVGGAIATVADQVIGKAATAGTALSSATTRMEMKAGGDATRYAAASQLFDTLTRKVVLDVDAREAISSAVAGKFGELPAGDREELAVEFGRAVSYGADMNRLIDSVYKLYRISGMDPLALVQMANATAVKTSASLEDTLVAVAAMHEGTGGAMGVTEALQFIRAGDVTYGDKPAMTAARVLRSISSYEPEEPAPIARAWTENYPRAVREDITRLPQGANLSQKAKDEEEVRRWNIGAEQMLGQLWNDIEVGVMNSGKALMENPKMATPYGALTSLTQGGMQIVQHFWGHVQPSIEADRAVRRERLDAARR